MADGMIQSPLAAFPHLDATVPPRVYAVTVSGEPVYFSGGELLSSAAGSGRDVPGAQTAER